VKRSGRRGVDEPVRSNLRSGILLATRELRRAKTRFGLLTAAVAFLSFLIIFQQALLEQLVDEFVGAIRQQTADVLVYGEQARTNLQASIVSPQTVDEVAGVAGVAAAGPLGVGTFTVVADGEEPTDATVLGYALGRPGPPRVLSSGRLPDGPGEAVVAEGDEAGFHLGAEVEVAPGVVVEVVGVAPDASLNVATTLYVDYSVYQAARLAQNPDATSVPPSAVAVAVDPGADPVQVANAINRAVEGVEALEREAAADAAPGVESVNQSLALILVLSYAVILVVTGFFFLILTVQKAPALTLLRALGAPAGSLVVAVLTQTVLVVVAGCAVGTVVSALTLLAPPFLGATLELQQVGITLFILLGLSAVASVGSIRRVLSIDPMEATVVRGAIR
jgi:putative ABC transport system permease protein